MENILTQHIEITSGIRGGKPRLAGTRVTVSDIVIMHLKMGQTVPEIAAEYNLNIASIAVQKSYFVNIKIEELAGRE